MIRRGRCAAALGMVLIAGLASRRLDDMLPDFVVDHAGDLLWATAVVLALAVIWPAWAAHRLGPVAFVIASAVEVSQLWKPTWLEDLRDNDFAALVLGRGFLWADFVRYGLGVALGLAIVSVLRASRFEVRPK